MVIDAADGDPLAALAQGFGHPLDPDAAVLGLSAAIADAAAVRPQCLLVDADGADPVAARRLYEVLATAARSSPVLAVIFTGADDAPGAPSEQYALPPLSTAVRRELITQRIRADPAVVVELASLLEDTGAQTPAASLRLLHALLDRGILVRSPPDPGPTAWPSTSPRRCGPGTSSSPMRPARPTRCCGPRRR